jgi:hypothetical protein
MFLFIICKCPADDVIFLCPAGSSLLECLLSEQLFIDELGSWSGVAPVTQEMDLCGREWLGGINEEGVKFCWKIDRGEKKAC